MYSRRVTPHSFAQAEVDAIGAVLSGSRLMTPLRRACFRRLCGALLALKQQLPPPPEEGESIGPPDAGGLQGLLMGESAGGEPSANGIGWTQLTRLAAPDPFPF